MLRLLLLSCLISGGLLAGQTVTIRVDAGSKLGPFSPAWAYFGYDEPNFTYALNGRKLIGELAQLSPTPVHIRTHFLLAAGDGEGALKWGSTNAYTEDSSGRPRYDWTVVDKILRTYINAGAIPMVEIGFMPKALSTHPEPYTPNWVPGAKNDNYYIGWTYPPKDYQKWGELVYQWVKHSVESYGKAAVESWDWEVWNEPNIAYWHGTPEEYNKLYDYAAAAVKRALPTAQVGGPASTGPDNAKAAVFLHQFLEHCATGNNYATGAPGAPLDFISYHVKGKPTVDNGQVRMGLSQELKDVAKGFHIVKSFPNFRRLPIILSEADPEGCAACSARVYPQNAYRNGTLYPAYEAAALKAMLDLQREGGINVQGILTWAFEFENQPYFDGFRTLATNGVDKPVLNFFRMAGIMRGERVSAESSAAVSAARILESGVSGHATVDALATQSTRSISVLVWHYQDNDAGGTDAAIDLKLSGIPKEAKRLLIRHYRIDQTHSNAYSAWQKMGSPQHPTPEQQAGLEEAGRLQDLTSPSWITAQNGTVDTKLTLPLQALSLLEFTW